MRSALLLVYLATIVSPSSRALAQGESTGAVAPAHMQLTLQIDDGIAEAERALIRDAIARELNATVLDTLQPGVPLLQISRSNDGSAALTWHESRPPVSRELPWNEDPLAAARDVALMAQNLVLDQTRDLLEPEAAPTPEPAPPNAPPAPQARRATLDTERPPDFAPKPPPPPPPPPIRNRARAQVMAVFAPDVEAPITISGDSYDNSSTAHGVLARFDVPFHPRLSAGGGIAIANWEASLTPESERHANLRVTATMDATAWLRGFVPLAHRIEVYGLAGAGPSMFTNLAFVDSSRSERWVRPYLGLNAALAAGTSVRYLDELGLALELAGQYHFLHGRDQKGSYTHVHALHLALLLGAVWSFDAR